MRVEIIKFLFLLFFICAWNKGYMQSSICKEAKDSKIWIADFEFKGDNVLVRGLKIDQIKNSSDSLLKYLEEKYRIGIKKIKLHNDTVFIKFTNSTKYTQQMGTSPADHCKTAIIFTLTENPNINWVNLDFEWGDHGGMPGTFSRESVSEQKYKVVSCE